MRAAILVRHGRTAGILATLLVGCYFLSESHAEQSARPENLTLEAFQFGPVNRWTFSHMREVLPTVNIPRDADRYLPLRNSGGLVTDFSVAFQERGQSIDEFH